MEYEASTRNQPCPSYTYAEALQRTVKSYGKFMKEESIEILLQRGLLQVEGDKEGEPRYVFSRDIKASFPHFAPFTVDQCLAFVENIDCHLMMFIFKQNFWLKFEAEDEEWHEHMNKMRAVTYANYERNCKSFRLVEMDGEHHDHLDNPESIAAEVNAFWKNVGGVTIVPPTGHPTSYPHLPPSPATITNYDYDDYIWSFIRH